MVIKTLLTFPIQDIDISTVAEYLVSALGDHRQRVSFSYLVTGKL